MIDIDKPLEVVDKKSNERYAAVFLERVALTGELQIAVRDGYGWCTRTFSESGHRLPAGTVWDRAVLRNVSESVEVDLYYFRDTLGKEYFIAVRADEGIDVVGRTLAGYKRVTIERGNMPPALPDTEDSY